MKKCVYFGWLASSSFNSVKKILRFMISKNIKVYYVGIEEYRESIENMGAIFIPYMELGRLRAYIDSDIRGFESGLRTKDELIDYFSYISRQRFIQDKIFSDSLIDIIKRINPDYIFRDVEVVAAKRIGEILGRKTVSFFSTIMVANSFYNENFIERLSLTNSDIKILMKNENVKYNELLDNVRENSGIRKSDFTNVINAYSSDDYINVAFGGNPMVDTIDSFKYRRFNFDIKGNNTRGLEEEVWRFINSNKRLVYVASGLSVLFENSLYNKIINGLDPEKYNVLISIPNFESNQVMPSNVLIKSFVNQEKVLERASVFITAGGYNSICDAINYEVPMIVTPIMNDQDLNAYLVDKNKLGVKVDFNNPNLDLDDIVDALLNDIFVKKQLRKAKEDNKELLNYKVGIEKILVDLEEGISYE